MAKSNTPRGYIVIGGVTYHWSGWYGSQLLSAEWFCPKPGTQRSIEFYDGEQPPVEVITIVGVSRYRMKYECRWGVRNSGTLDEYGTRIREFQSRLRRFI